MKFFVYGTLKVGGYFADMFDTLRKSCSTATLPGFDLFSLGSFPGIREGDGKIIGEIHEYAREDEVLANFDRIEGYNEANEKNSLYLRKTATAIDEEGVEHEVVIYVYNGSTQSARKIKSGVWPI